MKDAAFSSARLLRLYDRISDADDAIPRLRRFVLDLAVRGKLVEQEAADEPAAELLKRIAKEKAKKGAKPATTRSTSDPAAFEIPMGWAWTTLAGVSTVTMGQSPPGETYNTSGDGVPLINGPVEFTAGPFGLTVVNQYTTAPTNFCEKGDLLICVRGSTTGRTNVADFRACIGRGVAAIHSSFDDGFVRLFIWKARYDIIEMGRGIAFPSVSKKQIEDLAFPLPPLAEQQRIVAKVDELMALCDRLQQARTGREALRDRLTTASLTRLTAPETGADATYETFQPHARFALQALPTLTTRPAQIKTLRQTILNLAVRGRLVAQDAADEPAAELLKRIEFQTSQTAKTRDGKRETLEPSLSAADEQFQIPPTWKWVRLASLAEKITDGEHLSPNKTSSGMPLLTAVHVTGRGLTFENPQFVSVEDGRKFRQRCDPRRGDILICSRGTIGRCAVVDVEEIFCLMGSVILVRLPTLCLPEYFNYFLLTERAQEQMRGMSGATAVQALYLKDIRHCPLPLPPLAEQHRIVARVDALMALCDQLETSLTTTATTRSRLLEALLHEALAPAMEAA